MPSPLLGDAGLVPMCQVQGEQGAVAPPQVLQGKQKDLGSGHAHQYPSPASPAPPTPKPHHLMPDLPLGPQSFRLSGAHPEEADAPRDPPDLDQK